MKFHYSSYWGTWSRTLGRRDFYTVELDLTPVNGDRGDWARVRDIWVRQHCTSPGRNDVDVSKLPADVWSWIGEQVGGDIRHMLMTYDFLPKIDWDRYDAANNGGCAYQNCAVAPSQNEENAA